MRDYKLFLTDIKESIEKIQKYIKGFDFAAFKKDSKTFDSVVHNLLIIGEAAGNIPEKIQDEYNEIDWRGIIGMRNIIVHGYFTVGPDIIWKTIQDDLPILKKQIRKII